MRYFGKSLLAIAGLLTASGATALPLASLSSTDLSVVQVQYGGNCANWQQQCARLYGGGTQQWNECMNQPQALYDCGRGGYPGGGYQRGYQGGYVGGGYYQGGGDLCGNWRRQCARLYGGGSQQWHECMHQPQALADCGRY
jgi:hypothetical protein